eukprot:scaffold662512_cov92-Prasinocladus_malaysianus.AAC.1
MRKIQSTLPSTARTIITAITVKRQHTYMPYFSFDDVCCLAVDRRSGYIAGNYLSSMTTCIPSASASSNIWHTNC